MHLAELNSLELKLQIIRWVWRKVRVSKSVHFHLSLNYSFKGSSVDPRKVSWPDHKYSQQCNTFYETATLIHAISSPIFPLVSSIQLQPCWKQIIECCLQYSIKIQYLLVERSAVHVVLENTYSFTYKIGNVPTQFGQFPLQHYNVMHKSSW